MTKSDSPPKRLSATHSQWISYLKQGLKSRGYQEITITNRARSFANFLARWEEVLPEQKMAYEAAPIQQVLDAGAERGMARATLADEVYALHAFFSLLAQAAAAKGQSINDPSQALKTPGETKRERKARLTQMEKLEVPLSFKMTQKQAQHLETIAAGRSLQEALRQLIDEDAARYEKQGRLEHLVMTNQQDLMRELSRQNIELGNEIRTLHAFTNAMILGTAWSNSARSKPPEIDAVMTTNEDLFIKYGKFFVARQEQTVERFFEELKREADDHP